MSAGGERLMLELFPLPLLPSAAVALLGAGLLVWIPWALQGWRVPVGEFVMFVPREAVSAVVVASLLAGGALLSFGLAGLWSAIAGGPVTFDRTAGSFWRGGRRQSTRHAKPLADIRHVRLDRHGNLSRLLIETDDATLTLASDTHAEAVALPGRQLAEFLNLPLAGQ